MNYLLHLPGWNALHPLVIHFPIVLLLVAPLFIVAGFFLSKEKKRFALVTALLLMAAGTCGTYLAQATGEAAQEIVQKTPQIRAVLEHHEESAETTTIVFSVLSGVFAVMVLVPTFLRWEPSPILHRMLSLVFLMSYVAGTMVLVNTAHGGGRLVHELGIHASAPVSPQTANAAAPNDFDRD
jgi:uncharacterized membrane protein